MKTIQEQIEVMQHYANGGEVEIYKDKEWSDITNPDFKGWNFATFDFRIKEQKKTIIIEKWLLKTKGKEIYWEYATNEIDKYILCNLGVEKIKLLDSYEVEL